MNPDKKKEIKQVIFEEKKTIPFMVLEELEVIHHPFKLKHKMKFSHTTYDENGKPSFFYKLGECYK